MESRSRKLQAGGKKGYIWVGIACGRATTQYDLLTTEQPKANCGRTTRHTPKRTQTIRHTPKRTRTMGQLSDIHQSEREYLSFNFYFLLIVIFVTTDTIKWIMLSTIKFVVQQNIKFWCVKTRVLLILMLYLDPSVVHHRFRDSDS